MSGQPEPDAEELAARLRAHLAEVLRRLNQPPPRAGGDMVMRRGGWLINHGKGTVTRRQALTDESGEVRELTEADFRAMRPAAEVLPPELVAILPTRRQIRRAQRRNRRLAASP